MLGRIKRNIERKFTGSWKLSFNLPTIKSRWRKWKMYTSPTMNPKAKSIIPIIKKKISNFTHIWNPLKSILIRRMRVTKWREKAAITSTLIMKRVPSCKEPSILWLVQLDWITELCFIKLRIGNLMLSPSIKKSWRRNMSRARVQMKLGILT